jgi:hypothetical protein
MKGIALSIVLAALAAPAAFGQASYTTGGGNVCLKAYQVDHTRAPDDRTIIFFMKDNKAWITHLKSLCPQLTYNGFSYVATPPDEICGGLQAIRSNNTGAICMMGPFEPYTPQTHAGM